MKSITALICITAIVITALFLGHNSSVIISSVSILAGLGGFYLGRRTTP